MKKVIKPLPHAVLDYALAVLFLLAPALFGFQSDVASSLARLIGVAYLIVSALTRYPLGALKLIPFPVHGVLETIAALAWIAMPFLLGFRDDAAARNFFMLAGLGLVIVAALTDYRAAEPAASREERRVGLSDRRTHMEPVGRNRRVASRPRRQVVGYA